MNVQDISGQIQNAVVLTTPLLLQLIGLFLTIRHDPYVKKKHRRIMYMVICVTLGLIVQNLLSYQMLVYVNRPVMRTVVDSLGYIFRPVNLVLFCYVVSYRKKFPIAWALLVINTLVFLTPLFSDIAFSIDAQNTFQRGPLGYTCHIISAMLLANLLALTIREHGSEAATGLWIPVFNVVIITFSTYFDSVVSYRELPVTLLTIAIVSSCVFYYLWLHLQFAQAHEKALLAESRIQIMMSQIQPHFLYNTLSTIQALCQTDPEKAADVTEHFGAYLRQNLGSLKETNLVPIDTELEHTKTYADIEVVRFPYIRVLYDIQDHGAEIPALTVQPLVENAIRHGVRGKENGTVAVLTRQTENAHEIIVRDNGKGFSVEDIEGVDGSHIGIRNVRERIEKMCQGTLRVDSQKGVGTTITIRIPLGGGRGSKRNK